MAFDDTESYADIVRQDLSARAAAPTMGAKGLAAQFYKHPVESAIKSWGGITVLELTGRDDEARKEAADKLIKGWGCGAKLLKVIGKAQGRGFDDYEVEVEGAGRPIFDEEDYVFIAAPGDSLQVFRGPVWKDPTKPNSHVNRFPEQWRAYKAGEKQRSSGTPLEHWPVLTTSQVAELRALNFRTIEDVADMSDEVTGRFRGLVDLKQRAKAHLDAATKGATTQKLVTENQALKEQMDALKAQMAEMAAAMAKLKDPGAGKGAKAA